MSKNITPSPCNTCKRKQCIGLCSDYKIWFGSEWRRVVKPFRDLKNRRENDNGNIRESKSKNQNP